jgi:hypothetical protein
MGDLNNTSAAREHLRPVVDPEYRFRSFAISTGDDDPAVRQKYRPFLLDDEVSASDWIAKLELASVAKMVETELLSPGKDRLKVLVLYGSLRSRYKTPFAMIIAVRKNLTLLQVILEAPRLRSLPHPVPPRLRRARV